MFNNGIGSIIKTSFLNRRIDLLFSIAGIDPFDFGNKIDLVYIDPPFSTNTTFKIGPERTSTVSHSETDDVAYTDTLTGSGV